MINIFGTAILPFIETELVKHSPEIQAFILKELSTIAKTIINFVDIKIKNKEGQ